MARDSYQAGLTVAGLLAGFSFTGLVELSSRLQDNTVHVIMFVSFIIAAFCFVIAVMGFWATLEWIADKKNDRYKSTVYHGVSLAAFIGGMLSFSVGLGASGFIHSLVTGIGSSIGTAVVVIYFFATAISLAAEPVAPADRPRD